MNKTRIILAILGLTMSNCGQTKLNHMTDGGFELQETGQMQEPFHCKPESMPGRFEIVEGEEAFEGKKFVRMHADTATWFEVSQFIRLETNTAYQVSIVIRGDACEVHAGAYCYGSKSFLGWNNDGIPGKEWMKVSFDFVSDSIHQETKIYLDVKNDKNPIIVDMDDIKVFINPGT